MQNRRLLTQESVGRVGRICHPSVDLAGHITAGRLGGSSLRLIRVFSSLVALAAFAAGGAQSAEATVLTSAASFYVKLPALHEYSGAGAVAASPDGNFVYVTDGDRNRVYEFNSALALVKQWKSSRLQSPTGVTTDVFGNVYVANNGNGTVVKFTDSGKFISQWGVPFAKSIAARGGSVFVLTSFFSVVGDYSTKGQQLGGFVALLPGRWFPYAGYDDPSPRVAKAIGVDNSGNPIVVGESDQALSDPPPDCHNDIEAGIDNQPYADPLRSGEAARFTPSGTAGDYGWLNHSTLDCYHGWISDGYDPQGVAVDPNGGDVYVADHFEQRIDHLDPNLNDPDAYGGLPGDHVLDLPCPLCSDSSAPVVAQPLGVGFDCRSNLYLLTGSGILVKYLNQSPPANPDCVRLSTILENNPLTVFSKFSVTGAGKSKSVSLQLGCAFHRCVGRLAAVVSGSFCHHCALTAVKRVHLASGIQRTLSLRLTRRGSSLLTRHPGLAFRVLGKLKGQREHVLLRQHLREPATLGARCVAPDAVSGTAAVSGTLVPAQRHPEIVLEYVSPPGPDGLPTVVQRTVSSDQQGRFSDRYSLGAAGTWNVAVRWNGDRRYEPAAATPCGLEVHKTQTHVTLACPGAGAVGAPSTFSGALSGGPATAQVAVVYTSPSHIVITHVLSTGAGGGFGDTTLPGEPGSWQAIAHWAGDSNHAPASSAPCRFAVAPSTSTLALHCSAAAAQAITCSGRLTSAEAALGGAEITLSYQDPAGGPPTVHSATTLSDRTFSDEQDAAVGTLLTSGTWHVSAGSAGDSSHSPASASQDVTVS